MLMNLDISTWKPFKIEDLFYIKKGKTLSLLNKELYAGDIPCVNGSANNNGIFASLSPNANEIGLSLQKAPCITVSRVGNAGYAHVQHFDFYIADNAYSLKLKHEKYDNTSVYLFLATILNMETYKYSYGRIINANYFNSTIKLPAAKDGLPCFGFMENYMQEMNVKPVTTSVEHTQAPELKISSWGEYTLGELFKFHKGKRLTKEDMTHGSTNFIGAISENNGVRQLIDTNPMFPPNCITVNYNGSVGEAFYQFEPFWASDDVNVLYPNGWELNKYIAMFIITTIKANRYKFSYGRKWTLEKMKESLIKLPKSKNGPPDWAYMESYVKSLCYSDRI